MTLTAITGEGTDQQKTVTKQLRFGRAQARKSMLQLKYQAGEFVEVVL
jgi:hypothetical protein